MAICMPGRDTKEVTTGSCVISVAWIKKERGAGDGYESEKRSFTVPKLTSCGLKFNLFRGVKVKCAILW